MSTPHCDVNFQTKLSWSSVVHDVTAKMYSDSFRQMSLVVKTSIRNGMWGNNCWVERSPTYLFVMKMGNSFQFNPWLPIEMIFHHHFSTQRSGPMPHEEEPKTALLLWIPSLQLFCLKLVIRSLLWISDVGHKNKISGEILQLSAGWKTLVLNVDAAQRESLFFFTSHHPCHHMRTLLSLCALHTQWCQPCISMWVACALWDSHMFTVNLLDESQVCSCSLEIIHRLLFYPGGATGSWWSGSAKIPNWRRRCAAARSQSGQMPLLMYHVFQAGQQCVCVWAGVGGERTKRLPRHSHIDANLTHAWVLPMVCVTISASLTDLWGVPSLPFSSDALHCQDGSWRLLAAIQPIRREILSGGLCWMVCWQQAMAAQCQLC